MKRSAPRILLVFLVLASLLSLAAAPNVVDGPANVRSEPGGDVLAVLETGTTLTVSDVTCVDGTAWLGAAVDGQNGWIAAELVDLGDGAPAVSPNDRLLEL